MVKTITTTFCFCFIFFTANCGVNKTKPENFDFNKLKEEVVISPVDPFAFNIMVTDPDLDHPKSVRCVLENTGDMQTLYSIQPGAEIPFAYVCKGDVKITCNVFKYQTQNQGILAFVSDCWKTQETENMDPNRKKQPKMPENENPVTIPVW